MHLGIKIDFENTYEIEELSENLTTCQFKTTDINGNQITLFIRINNNCNPHLPNVYNLGFGPQKVDGSIDDKANIHHKDISKVFSTILFAALTFLKTNPDQFVGIDGSDLRRAYLYYKILQTNFDYLTDVLLSNFISQNLLFMSSEVINKKVQVLTQSAKDKNRTAAQNMSEESIKRLDSNIPNSLAEKITSKEQAKTLMTLLNNL